MPPLDQLDSLHSLVKKIRSFHLYVDPDCAHIHSVERVIVDQETPYQHIQILQTPHFGKLLILDGDPQSSEFDEDIYHEALVHPVLVTHPDPHNVLILGGGEGATLREVLRHPGVKQAFMVDIDEAVVNLCKKELPSYSKGAFTDPRATLITGDANKFLKETREKFDAVISDLTLPYDDSPAQGLVTQSYYQSVKNVLKDGGVFAMQALRADRGMNQLFVHNIAVLKKTWKIVRPYRAFIPSFYSEWGYIAASDRHDPLKVSGETVDQRLKPLASKLNYYDGLMHSALFVLPKDLRA